MYKEAKKFYHKIMLVLTSKGRERSVSEKRYDRFWKSRNLFLEMVCGCIAVSLYNSKIFSLSSFLIV